ncbi:acyl-CoA dehydrogenase C-terminal domain-containing protein, partial [Amnimonas aquatica]
GRAADSIAAATDWLIAAAAGNPDEVNAAAVDFLHAFGLLAYAHMWLLMLQASAGKDDAFHADKFKVGAFFFARLLPELDSRVASLRAGADTLMALSEDSF